jgi:hypothetical protein
LPYVSALTQYSRIRFVLNLLPLLQKAEGLRRVVSVGAATFEGAIDLTNISGEGFPLGKWRNQAASVATLLLEETARRAPNISFIHTVPGIVKSGIQRDAEGLGMSIRIGVANLLMPLIQTPPAECGERHLFFATSARYLSYQNGENIEGVPFEGHGEVARGTNGKKGSGMYSMDNKNESASVKVQGLLAEFRNDGTAAKVWNYITANLKRITGTDVAL